MRILLTIAALSALLWFLRYRRKSGSVVTRFEPASGRWERVCGRCRSGVLRRSRPRGPFGLLHRDTGFTRFYRCEACGWGAWLEVIESPREALGQAHAAPALETLDAPDFGAVSSDRLAPADTASLSLPDLGRVIDAPSRHRRRVRVSKTRARTIRYRSR